MRVHRHVFYCFLRMRIYHLFFIILFSQGMLQPAPLHDDEEDIGEINLEDDIDDSKVVKPARVVPSDGQAAKNLPEDKETRATTAAVKKEPVKKIPVKKKKVTRVVYYASGSSSVSKKYIAMLKKLRIPRGAGVLIQSYTDNAGNIKSNKILARKRSHSVYLVLKKIQPKARFRFAYGKLKTGKGARARKTVVTIYSR